MSERVRFGGFEADPFEADLRTGELWRAGERVRVQEQPFQVLAVLLRRPGELVTREELRQQLWPADTFVDFDHSLNTAINKLREALGDSASEPKYIETLARRGYRMIAPVTAAEAPQSQPTASPAVAPAGDQLPTAPRGLARGLFALIQVLYLACYIAALALFERFAPTHAYLGSSAVEILEAALLVSASVGIAARLYWLACVAFDLRATGQQFQRVFPLLALLDELWGLSPLLIWPTIGVGLAFAATAAMLFLPFSQRNLIRMAYGWPARR
jgi:DNA-binding winged helix-turn-helix (wHTH) protein